MLNECYFDTLDSEIKAYILGLVIFNIKDMYMEGSSQQFIVQVDSSISKAIRTELECIGFDFDQDIFAIKSTKIIQNICQHLNLTEFKNANDIDLTHFIKNNKRQYVVEFLKAFYEKYGTINKYEPSTSTGTAEYNCNITAYSKSNLDVFAEFFQIPCKTSNIFNLHQITYTNVNIIDLLGIIYKKHDIRTNDLLYIRFLKLLNLERPILKYIKTSPNTVTPTKANFSDVGYDVSIIGMHKVIVSKNETPVTVLYNTGIKLDIPIGYYVEMVPRSSISKSGYMLANSIGIIDCSYKGELLVALTKIHDDVPDIEFPFRCCQLILRKQNFPDMIEISEIETTKRLAGGVGSS